jgi:predicted DNA-binding transcriptional regulator AlpA
MPDGTLPPSLAQLPPIACLKEVATFFGVSTMTIRRWVKSQGFPPPTAYGPRTIRWPRDVIERWLREKQNAGR